MWPTSSGPGSSPTAERDREVGPPAQANEGADSRISSIVITRNRERELERTLRALTELPERPSVIVIDNASTDGTLAMVRGRFPGVKLVALRRNRGAAARNTGVLLAGTPYVAFSDDDSWWQPGALARACELLDANPALALIAGRILVGPGETLDPSCSLMARSPLPGGGLPGPAVLGFLACGAIVRSSAFEAVGGFRPGWGVGGEEQMLAVDLLAAGHRLAYVPAITAHHHPAGRHAARRRAATLRNDLWFAWMRRPLLRALRETLSLSLFALTHSDARRALAGSLSGAPWVLSARRPISRAVERDIRRVERQRRSPGQRAPLAAG